jgi:hypothetical protein
MQPDRWKFLRLNAISGGVIFNAAAERMTANPPDDRVTRLEPAI